MAEVMPCYEAHFTPVEGRVEAGELDLVASFAP